jgi:hypothetical protein
MHTNVGRRNLKKETLGRQKDYTEKDLRQIEHVD